MYLFFISCLNSKNTRQSLLPPSRLEQDLVDAIETLDAYAFISKRQDNHSFDVHRLVHLATRNWLRRKDLLTGWTENVVTRLADVFPNRNYENKPVWIVYLPHARYILASNTTNKTAEETFRLQGKVVHCLLADAKYDEAEKIQLEVLGWREKTQGPVRPKTPKRINSLAEALDKNGRREEAKEMGILALEEKMRVLGTERPDTLASMAELASIYRSQGRWKEAEALFTQAMGERIAAPLSPAASLTASTTPLPREPVPTGIKQLYSSENSILAEYVTFLKAAAGLFATS